MTRDNHSSLAHAAAIIKWSNDAIVGTTADDRITSWNPAAVEMFGYLPSEILGQPFELLVPSAEIEPRRAILRRAAGGEAFRGIEGTRRRKNGRIAEVETTISPVRRADGTVSGFSSIIRDVTGRKSHEHQLRELEFRYRTFFEEMPGLAYIHLPRDESQRRGLLHLSQHFGDLTGYPLESWMTDRDFSYTIMHPDDVDRVREVDRRSDQTGGPYRVEFRMITRDGRIIWVRDQANLVHDRHGRPQFWLGFLFDITELKRAESRLNAALAGQLAAYQELEKLSRAKSEFVSIISHEFRTPLTSIQGFSELMIDEELTTEDFRSFARTINLSAVRLARMIGDVLDLDRLEAGQFEFRPVAADLNALVADVLQSLRPTSPHHSLMARPDPSLPLITVDVDLMVRVITNLVANAVKYSPRGGEVTVSTAHEASVVRVSVVDQGLGIPADVLESIFLRYARISRPEQAGIAGTGLGLPIARQIVELHGGRIWAESNGTAGSMFCVELPKEPTRSDAR